MTGPIIFHCDPETVELRQTVRLRDLDGCLTIARRADGKRPRFVWRGPATDPVFALENTRESVIEHIDVVCETPCTAVFLIRRTKSGKGVIPSTLHQFRDVRIFGNGRARRGYDYSSAIDENNEHGRWDSCSVYGCTDSAWVFSGQQSKEHVLTQCRAESVHAAVTAGSSFTWISGTAAVCQIGVVLSSVGDPVVIEGVGFEACRRLLVTSGPTTASQPVTLIGVRYEADQLHEDGDCILLRHAGPLSVTGCRFGGGKQRIPRVALLGAGPQVAMISGNTFGAFGAHRVCPVRAQNHTNANVTWGNNAYQRDALDPQNVESRLTWADKSYT